MALGTNTGQRGHSGESCASRLCALECVSHGIPCMFGAWRVARGAWWTPTGRPAEHATGDRRRGCKERRTVQEAASRRSCTVLQHVVLCCSIAVATNGAPCRKPSPKLYPSAKPAMLSPRKTCARAGGREVRTETAVVRGGYTTLCMGTRAYPTGRPRASYQTAPEAGTALPRMRSPSARACAPLLIERRQTAGDGVHSRAPGTGRRAPRLLPAAPSESAACSRRVPMEYAERC